MAPRKPPPPKGTLVLLVRHGETPTTGRILPGRAKGLHLSDAGRAQADAVAERLSVLPTIDAIYASPLERTRETAKPIAADRRLPVTVDKGLLEADIGDWTGMELKVAAKTPEWKAVHSYPSGFRFPGGESFPEMQQRIVGAIERLRQAHPGQVIVLVSHADPIKAAVAHALGTHLDLFQRIVISPCSVTAIAYGDGGPTVLSVNSLGDLRAVKPSCSSSFDLGDVDGITVGTVGEPGRRVFYLQAVSGTQVVSLKLEKQQVAALVTYLATLLSDLPSPGPLPTDLDLVEPVLPEWVVGALGVSYDETTDRVLVQAEELMEEETDDGATARFLTTREQVAALAARGAEVITAGRPPCPLCGQPLDPEGHVCVRLNGHRSQSR